MTSPSQEQATTLAEGKYLRLAKRGHWEYAQRINITGIVAMLAYTRREELLLVEQYRPPLARRVIEIPAGLVGDLPENREEPMLEAAKRELLEETGWQGSGWELLGEDTTVSAGTTGETIHLYRATELERINDGGGDDSEDITVHCVPLEHLHSWLKDQKRSRDVLVDVKVYLGPTFAPGEE